MSLYQFGNGQEIPISGASAPNLFTFQRNNPESVAEFLTVAQSYAGLTSIVYNDGNTPLYLSGETNGIDCSTFVGLCLMGIPYSKSPYATGVYGGPSALKANTADYPWAIRPMDYAISRYTDGHNATEMVRLACQMGRWLRERCREVPLTNGLVDVQPGDIVLWGRKVKSTGAWLRDDWYEHINHIGIVSGKEAAPNTYSYVDSDGVTQTGTWDKSKYPYMHTIIESTSVTPTIRTTMVLEEGQAHPLDVYKNNVNTIRFIVRPDLP